MANLETRIGSLAAGQDGVVSRAQIVHLGATDAFIKTRLASGAWRRIGSGGVYLLVSHRLGWRQRNRAALLAHPAGVLGSASAARLYRLEPVLPAPLPHLTVPPGTHARSSTAHIRRSSLLRRRLVDGFAVNSLPHVLLEVAVDHPGSLEALYQEAILHRRTTFDLVADTAVRASAGRIPGARRLRLLLEQLGAGHEPAQSQLETHLYRMLEHPDLPPIVRQAPAPWSPGREHTDASIPDWGMIVEGDGRVWHARIAALANDRRRDRAALAHGLITVRFGWAELVDDVAGCRATLLDTARAFDRIR